MRERRDLEVETGMQILCKLPLSLQRVVAEWHEIANRELLLEQHKKWFYHRVLRQMLALVIREVAQPKYPFKQSEWPDGYFLEVFLNRRVQRTKQTRLEKAREYLNVVQNRKSKCKCSWCTGAKGSRALNKCKGRKQVNCRHRGTEIKEGQDIAVTALSMCNTSSSASSGCQTEPPPDDTATMQFYLLFVNGKEPRIRYPLESWGLETIQADRSKRQHPTSRKEETRRCPRHWQRHNLSDHSGE